MFKTLKPILAVFITAAMASVASAASVSYTNSQIANSNNTSYALNLNQFNTGLGTLTGVSVTIVFLKDGGSFTVTANAPGTVEIDTTKSLMQLNDPTGLLGFTGYSNSAYVFTTTPNANGAIVADPQGVGQLSSPQTFTVATNTIVNNSNSTITSGFWSAYQGAGNVAFALKQNPQISAFFTGNGGSFDTTAFLAQAQMSVTYTYDAAPPEVPEPSTVVAGAMLLGLGVAGAIRRRKQAKLA